MSQPRSAPNDEADREGKAGMAFCISYSTVFV